MKKEPRKLEVGERVMVYGWVQMHHSPYIPRCGGLGTLRYSSDDDYHVEFDGDDKVHYSVHRYQLRPLRKVKKVKVFPKFVGVSRLVRDGFGAINIQIDYKFHTHALFSLPIEDIAKLTDKQKERYGVK